MFLRPDSTKKWKRFILFPKLLPLCWIQSSPEKMLDKRYRKWKFKACHWCGLGEVWKGGEGETNKGVPKWNYYRLRWELFLSDLLSLAIQRCGEAYWKLIKKTEDAKFYYDNKNGIQSPQKMVKVWIIQAYMKKGKLDMVALVGAGYEKLSYLIFTNGLLFHEWICSGPRKSPRSMGIDFYKLDVWWFI